MEKRFQILATTDLSTPARHAVDRAAMLSHQLSGRLGLLHVADLQPLERLRALLGQPTDDMEKKVLGVAQHKMQELANTLEQRHGVKAQLEVKTGKLIPLIQHAIEQQHADLLVCGSKGESFLRHMALGSTAVRLLHGAACPLLVVKQPARRTYQRVLVPVDFSGVSMDVIRQAKAFAPDADLVLLHAFEVPFEGKMRYAQLDEDTIRRYQLIARQESMERLQHLRDQAQLSPEKTWLVVMPGDAATRIVEQEQECDCDLIVMGKHGEGALEELLLGSVTKRVLADSNGDVLVTIPTP